MPSAVNFFTGLCADGSSSDDTTDAPLFGICDDFPVKGIPRKRAYINHDNPKIWLATVENEPRHQVVFKGVDNCIDIRKGNGNLQSRCDGILLYDEFTVFIELKSRADDSTKWVTESAAQVKQTITDFRKSHPDNVTILEAYLVNAQRPEFQEGRQNFTDRFFKDTGVILHVEATIKLEQAF